MHCWFRSVTMIRLPLVRWYYSIYSPVFNYQENAECRRIFQLCLFNIIGCEHSSYWILVWQTLWNSSTSSVDRDDSVYADHVRIMDTCSCEVLTGSCALGCTDHHSIERAIDWGDRRDEIHRFQSGAFLEMDRVKRTNLWRMLSSSFPVGFQICQLFAISFSTDFGHK